jgi:hypothetical protein
MIEQFFSRECIPALKFLGGREWLSFKNDNGKTVFNIENVKITREDYLRYSDDDLAMVRKLVDLYCSTDPKACLFTQTVAKALFDGPKLFCPNKDQCHALENTEANVTFDFYKQPYPTIIIELPKDYREYLKAEHAVAQVPQYVLSYQHTNGMLVVTAWFNRDNVVVNTMTPSEKYVSIEDAIEKNRNNADPDFKLAETVQRLALNFSLMMTMLGVKIIGPLDSEAFKRNKRNAKSDDPKKAERARKFLESTEYLCEFQQQINFFDVAHDEERRGDGSQEHKSPKPHWRRGHFRQQAHGPKLSQRKLVYIKPILVMSRFFAGDKSDTAVTYKAKEPGV